MVMRWSCTWITSTVYKASLSAPSDEPVWYHSLGEVAGDCPKGYAVALGGLTRNHSAYMAGKNNKVNKVPTAIPPIST